MTTTTETQSQTGQQEITTPIKKSRKSVVTLAIVALGINTTAAIYTLSPDSVLQNISSLPDISRLAELIPHPKAPDPVPVPAIAALQEIQSTQQQYVAALQANNLLLQQNTDLVRQDSIALASLRQSVVDEHVDVKKISTQIADEHQDVKKISAQLSTLIAKVDSLKNVITPEVTSSISARHAQNRLSRVRKKMARQPQPVGPVSLGGAPLSPPATTTTPQS